jgi:hypothetical protein
MLHAVLLLATISPVSPSSPGSYPLDHLTRDVPAKGPVRCPSLPLVLYQGKQIRYSHPARVHPASPSGCACSRRWWWRWPASTSAGPPSP